MQYCNIMGSVALSVPGCGVKEQCTVLFPPNSMLGFGGSARKNEKKRHISEYNYWKLNASKTVFTSTDSFSFLKS